MDEFAASYSEFLQDDVVQVLPMDTSDRHKKHLKKNQPQTVGQLFDDYAEILSDPVDYGYGEVTDNNGHKQRAPRIHSAWNKVEDAGSKTVDFVEDKANEAWDDITGGVNDATNWIKNLPSEIGNEAEKVINDAENMAENALSGVENAFDEVLDDLGDMMPDGHRFKEAAKVVGLGILLVGGVAMLWGSKEQNRQKVYKGAKYAAGKAAKASKYAVMAL